MHLMARLKASKDGLEMLANYLLRLERLFGARENVERLIAEVDPIANKNVLTILTNSMGGGGKSQYRDQMIELLSSYSTKTIHTVPAPDIAILLGAVHEYGKQLGLTHVFINADDEQIVDMAKWVVMRKQVIDKTVGRMGMITIDNLKNPEVKAAFSAAMAGRSSLNRLVKNVLVKSAFDIGAKVSPRKALNRVASLIDAGLIADEDLKTFDFDAFGKGNDGLLGSVLRETPFKMKEDMDKIIANLRPKFANVVEWQAYLDAKPMGRDSVVQELTKKLSGDEIAAESWLGYAR